MKNKGIPEGTYRICLTTFKNQKHKDFIAVVQDGPQKGKAFRFLTCGGRK
ncbi:hypothetical protein LCGC14_0959170 [marine sediment metagenome]|uniref:Uncharacterized protein n=1 Tax=marine sediment metagenome TaxID=412755 RepID=A0A0F9NEX3_9ZZZZ